MAIMGEKIIFRDLSKLVCHCIHHWDVTVSLYPSTSADLSLFCKPAGGGGSAHVSGIEPG